MFNLLDPFYFSQYCEFSSYISCTSFISFIPKQIIIFDVVCKFFLFCLLIVTTISVGFYILSYPRLLTHICHALSLPLKKMSFLETCLFIFSCYNFQTLDDILAAIYNKMTSNKHGSFKIV